MTSSATFLAGRRQSHAVVRLVDDEVHLVHALQHAGGRAR
jgi:hypothetical protein